MVPPGHSGRPTYLSRHRPRPDGVQVHGRRRSRVSRDRSLLVAARLSAALLSAACREARRCSRLVPSRVRPLDAAVPVDRRRHDAAAGGRRRSFTLARARLLRPALQLRRDARAVPAPHGAAQSPGGARGRPDGGRTARPGTVRHRGRSRGRHPRDSVERLRARSLLDVFVLRHSVYARCRHGLCVQPRDGAGAGATRRCEFSTGTFVEPITEWEAPSRLSFDIAAQPAPLRELSPYGTIAPPHLHGYFRARRGAFRLTALPRGRTLLVGATWYELGIEPRGYWKVPADAIVSAIHRRVLLHIKQLTEAGS